MLFACFSFGGPGAHVPPSAGSGVYLAFIPGNGALQLQLPPSVLDEVAVVLSFRNSHPSHDVEVYWVDYEGQLTLRRVLTYVLRLSRPVSAATVVW